MASKTRRLMPSITSMIRMDHTHVVAAFHRYRQDLPAVRKRAIAEHICIAVEVHAQLEEEIFYPALRSVVTQDAVLDKSEPEHDEMREFIARLRQDTDPTTASYDEHLFGLMRTVLRHVADEETQLLPAAERLLGDQLIDLGMQMTKRRLQLLAPRAARAAVTGARTFPLISAAAGIVGAAAIGSVLLARRRYRRRLSL